MNKLTSVFLSVGLSSALLTGCKDSGNQTSGSVDWADGDQQMEEVDVQQGNAANGGKRIEGPSKMKMSMFSCVVPEGWYVCEQNSKDHVSSLKLDRIESGTGRRLFGIEIWAAIGGVQSADEKLEAMVASFKNANGRIVGERTYGNVTYKLFQYGDSEDPHSHLIAPMPKDPRRGLINITLNTNDPDDAEVSALLSSIEIKK